jgi:trans-aconitate methyltransferase
MWIALAMLAGNLLEWVSDFFEMFARFFRTLAKCAYVSVNEARDNTTNPAHVGYEED